MAIVINVNPFKPTVVFVDDDENMLRGVTRALGRRYNVVSFCEPAGALSWLKENHRKVDVILSDLAMPGFSGMRFLREMVGVAPSIPRVLLSGHLDNSAMNKAINTAFVSCILSKPASIELIRKSIEQALSTRAIDLAGTLITPGLVMRALKNNGYSIVFQPRIDAKTGSACGLEVLVRFPSLQKRFLLEEIILACEGHPAINLLTTAVMNEVRKQSRDIRSRFDFSPTVSINCSPYSIRNNCFLEEILHFRSDMLLCDIRIEVEITEHSDIVKDPAFLANAEILKNRGVAIYIDDFGSGSNSVELLEAGVFAGVKIDREFIATSNGDCVKSSFAEWIVKASHDLGLRVVAEGVEDAVVAQRMQALGVEEMQGFFFARPATLEKTPTGAFAMC
nr:EAL domain-containing protein [Thalassospira sp. A3_1]